MDLSAIKVTPQNRAALELLLKHAKARENFLDWAVWSEPSQFKIRKSTQKIADFLQKAMADQIPTVIISAPPRAGKSHLVSSWLAHLMATRPGAKVVLASYSEALASSNSRRVQSFFTANDYVRAICEDLNVTSGHGAFDDWSLTNGSRCRSVGSGGSLTGYGAWITAIDDPHSNYESANSDVQTKMVHAWFDSVVDTRRERHPDGSPSMVVIIATRWSLKDLTSYVMQRQAHDPDSVRLLNLPALDEYDQPLDIEQEDFYRKQKANLPSRIFQSLYQGSPIQAENALISSEDLDLCNYSPNQLPDTKSLNIFGASDYAMTSGSGDYSVHVIFGICPESYLWILDIWRKRAAPQDVLDAQQMMSDAWRPLVWYEEGDASTKIFSSLRPRQLHSKYGNAQHQALFKTMTHGGKGKEVRAFPLAQLISTHKIKLPRANMHFSDLQNELLSFPSGKNDDILDALALGARAFGAMHSGNNPPAPPSVEQADWNATSALIQKPTGIYISPRVSAELFDLTMTSEFATTSSSRRIG